MLMKIAVLSATVTLIALCVDGIPVTEKSSTAETCHILPCDGELNAACQGGQCVCAQGTQLTADGFRCEADGTASLGDRLVLQNDWIEHGHGGSYDALPLTVANALDDRGGWNVSDTCIVGRGREAANPSFANGLVNLWFGQDGVIVGYEVFTPAHRLNDNICHDHKDGSRCAMMFRRQAEVDCAGPALDAKGVTVTSIGDRLLFPYWGKSGGEFPLTVTGIKAHSPPFIDAQSCLANMGHHYVAPMLSTTPLIPMYYEKSGIIDGLLISDPIPDHQPSPPFEKFADFNNAMSLHFYYKDHMGACDK